MCIKINLLNIKTSTLAFYSSFDIGVVTFIK